MINKCWLLGLPYLHLHASDYDLTYSLLSSYGLQMDIIRLDFKSGLESLLKAKPIRAIFLGVRIGDPTAVYLILYFKKLYIYYTFLHILDYLPDFYKIALEDSKVICVRIFIFLTLSCR